MSLEREYARTHQQFRLAAGAAAAAIGGGTVFYHFFEHLGWVDSFYFTVVTLATVGYGDIVPKTDLGKLFTSFYILIGIGIIAGFATILVKRAVLKRQVRSAGNR